MANDRVWLYCVGCDERRLLLKYYPNGGSYQWKPGELEGWLVSHIECGNPKNTLGCAPFRLENDENPSGDIVETIVAGLA